ncbi:MAG: TerD family protein [Eubacterium sp.]|nr:TerD family protein [Eubacterium sp.]
MKKTINEILLRRKNKIFIEVKPDREFSDKETSKINRYIATVMKNFETIGYTFSKNLFEALQLQNTEEIEGFYSEVKPILNELVGADKKYNPMYPDFPKSVMEEEEAVLYINAVVHYWSYGQLYPVSEKEAKPSFFNILNYRQRDRLNTASQKETKLPLFDETNMKIIDLASKDDIIEIFNNLCQSKTSLSETDKEDLTCIFKNITPTPDFPDEIFFKENTALIGKLYIESSPAASADGIKKYFKTATDVLRLITAMSGGDISLADNTKYRNFKRRERRLLLELLQSCGSIEEDMLRYKTKWIRIGEKFHPGEYSEIQYGRVITAFNKLRNNIHIDTFNSRVEAAIKNQEYGKALKLLSNRPGELARRLDHLLRSVKNKDDAFNIINTFKNVSAEVSSPVLLQVKEHFSHDNTELEARVFFPKGSLARSYCIENNLPGIPEKYRKAFVAGCENALIEIYKQKDYMGSVYLSEDFKNYTVPFSQRSTSKAAKIITRGSKIPFDKDTKAMRAFIWWTNDIIRDVKFPGNSRVDLDLSATFFDENWRYVTHISYTNLRETKLKACHSGDITDGGPVDGEGVTEFLDIDIDAAREQGIRYIAYQVYSFTQQKFSSLPHAMFGWMLRENVNSGEIYEPKTVEQTMDLTSESVVCIPVIFDCIERKFIWCDMNLSFNSIRNRFYNNVESNLCGTAAVCYSVVNMAKPNLYDLIELHIKARGLRTDSKEDADIIFDINPDIEPAADIQNNFENEPQNEPSAEKTEDKSIPRVITPYDLDIFMGEFL